MSVQGRWRVVETPGYDMAAAGAYILFDQDGGEFAFDCLTGSIYGTCGGDAVEFGWDGNDEMEQATAGPNCRTTAHSKARYASKTATTSPLSLVARPLLQQPARGWKPDSSLPSYPSNQGLGA